MYKHELNLYIRKNYDKCYILVEDYEIQLKKKYYCKFMQMYFLENLSYNEMGERFNFSHMYFRQIHKDILNIFYMDYKKQT